MAQQTTDAMDALAENENVSITRLGGHCENDAVAYVYGEARTSGPALDPVQVWADHQAEYTVHHYGDTENSTAYYLNEVQA